MIIGLDQTIAALLAARARDAAGAGARPALVWASDGAAPLADQPLAERGLAWSWEALAREVDACADQLQRGSLSAGDSIVIQLPRSRAALVAGLAAWRLGLVVLPIPMDATAETLAIAMRMARPVALLGESSADALGPGDCLRAAAIGAPWVRFLFGFGPTDVDGVTPLRPAAATDPAPVASPSPKDLALITLAAQRTGDFALLGRSQLGLAALGQSIAMVEPQAGAPPARYCPYHALGQVALAGVILPWLMGGGTLCLDAPLAVTAMAGAITQHAASHALLPHDLADVLSPALNRAIAARGIPAGCLSLVAPPSVPLASRPRRLAADIAAIRLTSLGDAAVRADDLSAPSPEDWPAGRTDLALSEGARFALLAARWSHETGARSEDLMVHGLAAARMIPSADQGSTRRLIASRSAELPTGWQRVPHGAGWMTAPAPGLTVDGHQLTHAPAPPLGLDETDEDLFASPEQGRAHAQAR